MKIGLLGYGSIGKRHFQNLSRLKAIRKFDLHIFDPAIEFDSGDEQAVKHERMIYDRCDAVIVATPSSHHETAMRKAIELGKHVFVEKPISISSGLIPTLLERAYEQDLVVMMGNNLRFHACVKKTKEWIDHPNHFVGGPIWAQFTCATKSVKPLYLSDGVILNTGAHEVDLAMYLLGPARVVTASVSINDDTGNDEMVDFVLDHRNGCRSTFHLDFLTKMEIREYRIIGNEGDLYCHLPSRYLVRREHDGKPTKYNGPGSYDSDYLDEISAFIDRVEGKSVPCAADGYFGLDVLRVLLDVRKMARLA
jgi:predicted dehydrogenase